MESKKETTREKLSQFILMKPGEEGVGHVEETQTKSLQVQQKEKRKKEKVMEGKCAYMCDKFRSPD